MWCPIRIVSETYLDPANAGSDHWSSLSVSRCPKAERSSEVNLSRITSGRRPTLLVYRVICTDQEAMSWSEEDMGNLRVALNALVRLFRL